MNTVAYMVRRKFVRIFAAIVMTAVAACGTRASDASAPRVVVSIKPLHSLIAGVMRGFGHPTLLLGGAGSPHAYSMKPSKARALNEAEIVFWIGEELETFLTRSLAGLPTTTTVVALGEATGVTHLAARKGGAWRQHKHHDHHHDPHLWLNPSNAIAMVEGAALTLARVDPGNADRYQDNARGLTVRLTELDHEIAKRLAPVTDAPYIVFHDAYQHLERRYGLNAVGAITVAPDRKPSAKRLYEIRDAIRTTNARCVFSEPQFEPAMVETVVEGTQARKGMLDPLGVDFDAGEEAYFRLMRGVADSLRRCLDAPN